MPYLPELSDRLWFAIHCLERDETGAPPSFKSIEDRYGLPNAFLSKLVRGSRKQGYADTFSALVEALNGLRPKGARVKVTQQWLADGGDDGTPEPTGVVPPRPDQRWRRHGDEPGWGKAVDEALRVSGSTVPPAAYLAGADLPVYRPVDTITPELATAVAIYAWETCTVEDQLRYEEKAAKLAGAGQLPRARSVTRPSAKR
jgi:hypothetical protein